MNDGNYNMIKKPIMSLVGTVKIEKYKLPFNINFIGCDIMHFACEKIN